MAMTAGAFLLTAGGSVAAATAAYGAFTVYAVGFIATTAATNLVLRALTPKPSSATNTGGYNITANGTALDHQIIYGRVKISGARVYDKTTGSSNKTLHRVLAFSGHEIQSFDEIYLNDELLTIDGSGNVTSPSRYNGYVTINKHLGTSDQEADSDMVANIPEWSEDHRLRGIAYLYIKYTFDVDVFPNGVPEISAVIKGKKVYDPRSGTTAWSDNPALCIRDYLTQTSYGMGELESSIDDDLVISAANVCAQTNTIASTTRYTCNGAFTTGATPYDMLSSLLTSMGGTLWYAQGKWRMKPAYWTTPVLTLDENDLRSSVSLATRHSRRDNFNSVKGTFRGEESNWQVTDFPPLTNSAFVTADNGQKSVIDLSLPFTDNSIEARRISRIVLERNRQQLTVSASFGLRAFEVQIGDNVYLNNTRFGWENKAFEVVSWTFGLVDNLDLQVNMTLREVSASVFDEVNDGIIYERDNTTLPSPFFVPEVGINVNSVAQVSNQKVTNIAEVVVTSDAPEFVDKVEVGYKRNSSSSWRSAGNGPLGTFEIVDLEVGFYDFRARAVNTFGVKGNLTTLTNIEVNPFTGPPSNIQGFSIEVAGNTAFLKWEPIPDPDLSHYIIKFNSASTGATWNNSSTLVQKVARPSTSVAVPARAGTYLIRAFDKEGFLSEEDATFVVSAALIPPLGNTLPAKVENPTFTGSKTNVVLVSNSIEIDDTSAVSPTGTYFFKTANITDVSIVRNVRVTGYATFTRKYAGATLLWDSIPNLWDSWPNEWDNWTDPNASFGGVDVQVYVSYTSDDPASGGAVWSAYSLASGSFFIGRGFRFKAVLSSDNTDYTPNITALSVVLEY